jgi:hypothetical protein
MENNYYEMYIEMYRQFEIRINELDKQINQLKEEIEMTKLEIIRLENEENNQELIHEIDEEIRREIIPNAPRLSFIDNRDNYEGDNYEGDNNEDNEYFSRYILRGNECNCHNYSCYQCNYSILNTDRISEQGSTYSEYSYSNDSEIIGDIDEEYSVPINYQPYEEDTLQIDNKKIIIPYDIMYNDSAYIFYDQDTLLANAIGVKGGLVETTNEKTIVSSWGEKCNPISPISLTMYTTDEYSDLFGIWVINNKEVLKGTYLMKKEMKEILLSDYMNNSMEAPNNIMCIYTTPYNNMDLLTGLTGRITGNIVIRLPINQIYITYGSMKKVLNSKNKEWFALPIFNGKRRRLGNLMGIFGASMNHGQIPGYVIYKLYTKKEINENFEIKIEQDDFPHVNDYFSYIECQETLMAYINTYIISHLVTPTS